MLVHFLSTYLFTCVIIHSIKLLSTIFLLAVALQNSLALLIYYKYITYYFFLQN